MCFYFLHHLIFPLPPNLPLSLTSIFVITIERNRKDSANLGWYGAWFEGVGGCDAESRLSRDNGYMILLKGNELYQAIVGKRTSPRTRCTLKQRWLDRFMKRRPLLSLRLAQGIKWVRAEASIEGLTAFFLEFLKHLFERSIVDEERLFNMDETGFGQSQNTKKVVAI